jgi:hypothetical protein
MQDGELKFDEVRKGHGRWCQSQDSCSHAQIELNDLVVRPRLIGRPSWSRPQPPGVGSPWAGGIWGVIRRLSFKAAIYLFWSSVVDQMFITSYCPGE